MPWNEYLVLLLGGYWFLFQCHRFRFRAARLSGQKILLEAAMAGGVAGVVSFSAIYWLEVIGWDTAFHEAWVSWVGKAPPFDFRFLGTLAFGLTILVLAPIAVNRFIPRQSAKELALQQLGTRFEQLLFRSARDGILLGVTLENSGYFLGWAVETPSLHEREAYFRFLPVMIGTKDPSKAEPDYHQLINYYPGAPATDDDLFESAVLLRIDDIQTARVIGEDEAQDDADEFLERFARQEGAEAGN